MRRLLVLALLFFAPDLSAQQGPPNEWWHYNYKDWREYPILDIPFSAIGK